MLYGVEVGNSGYVLEAIDMELWRKKGGYLRGCGRAQGCDSLVGGAK